MPGSWGSRISCYLEEASIIEVVSRIWFLRVSTQKLCPRGGLAVAVGWSLGYKLYVLQMEEPEK